MLSYVFIQHFWFWRQFGLIWMLFAVFNVQSLQDRGTRYFAAWLQILLLLTILEYPGSTWNLLMGAKARCLRRLLVASSNGHLGWTRCLAWSDHVIGRCVKIIEATCWGISLLEKKTRERVDGQQTPLFGFAFHGSCPWGMRNSFLVTLALNLCSNWEISAAILRKEP